jgi:Tfp pilus assembly pilus retraction ATPase PilT
MTSAPNKGLRAGRAREGCVIISGDVQAGQSTPIGRIDRQHPSQIVSEEKPIEFTLSGRPLQEPTRHE